MNEFVKRLRAFKIHILIIGELKKHMPSVFGKKSASNKVLGNLHEHFDQVDSHARLFIAMRFLTLGPARVSSSSWRLSRVESLSRNAECI